MKCKKCGTVIEDNDAKFCPLCGAKAEKEPQPTQSSESQISLPVWTEWTIEKQLGRGSFGTVYKAVRRDNNVESYSAIKVISIPSDASEVDSLRSEGLDLNGTRTYFQGIVNDFVGEIQMMQSLKGIQNIVSVEDYKVVEKKDEIGWDIFIRMELLTPFNNYICDKKLTEQEVIKLGNDICTALEICSKRNIIHRDIKPENIFINDFGDFKLGDFGIARKLENTTGGLSQKGTFNYMAPEVASGTSYDARVDTYSLGIVLYRLLNDNRLPFLDNEKQLLNPNERRAAIERRMHGEPLPAPCNASPAMANLILRACAFDPDQRFASATEMKQALTDVLKGSYRVIPLETNKTVSVRKASPAPSGGKTKANTFDNTAKKKKKLLVGIIAAVLALAVLVGAGIYFVPKFLEGSYENIVSEDKDLSRQEKQKISEIIEEAEKQSSEKKYSEALKTVEDALVTYPDSVSLKNKQKEYSALLEEQRVSEILSQAEDCAKSEDYAKAVQLIDDGLKDYPESQDLLTKKEEYGELLAKQEKDKSIAEAKTLADKGNYDEAIAMLNTAEQLYGTDSEIDSAKYSIEKAKLFSQIAQYEAEGKLGDAIKCIDNCKSTVKNDNEIIQKRNSLKQAFISTTVESADAALKSTGYEDAIAIIDDALKVLPSEQEFLDKQNEYEGYKPIDLFSLEYFNAASNFAFEDEGPQIAKDNEGNTHYHTYQFEHDFYYSNTWVEYKIGKKYNKLSGTFFLDFDWRTTKEEAHFYVYGDGKLLYDGVQTGGNVPFDFDIDITNVDVLRIEYKTGIWDSSGFSCAIFAGIFDNTYIAKQPS